MFDREGRSRTSAEVHFASDTHKQQQEEALKIEK